MTCTINWNVLNFSEWEQRFKQISHSNILQSYPYAQAAAELDNQKPRFGLIKIDGKDAGMLQILEAGLLKNLIHGVVIDRGPLWFDGFGGADHVAAFITELNRQFPARFGRKRRFIPEMEDTPETMELLSAYKFARQGTGGYETIWLDLCKNKEVLRQSLKKNWRGALKKAEEAKISTLWDDKGEHFAWLMQNYMQDRAEKGYDGPSLPRLKSLGKYTIPRREMIIGRAFSNGKPIAGIMIICHGSSATYQIGYTSNAGRDKSAHHILLWNALSELKSRHIKDFDLGGMNEDTAKGVRRFKQGMGGQTIRLAGLFT